MKEIEPIFKVLAPPKLVIENVREAVLPKSVKFKVLVVFPTGTLLLFPLTDRFGLTVTVTAATLVLVQPAREVPVKE